MYVLIIIERYVVINNTTSIRLLTGSGSVKKKKDYIGSLCTDTALPVTPHTKLARLQRLADLSLTDVVTNTHTHQPHH